MRWPTTKTHRDILICTVVLLCACGPRLVGFDDDAADPTTGDSTTEDPTASDETTTDGTTTTTTTGPSAGFAGPPDHPDTPCDEWLQDCPEGEKCVPYASSGSSWDATKCVPVTGSQATGEPCVYDGAVEATDDCDASGVCWDSVEVDGLHGYCRAFCTGTYDNPVCEPDSECLLASEGVINLCIPHCDPLAQDCDAGLGCYWLNSWFLCVFTTTDIPTGEPCGYVNDCAPGNMCIDASNLPACNGAACCTNFCNVDLGPEQCDGLPGTSCVPFFEEGISPPGYEQVGLCLLMP